MYQDKPRKEYETDIEYLEETLLWLHEMHSNTLENVRTTDALIKDLQADLKVIKTPELKAMVENYIKKNEAIKQQGLDIIKRTRKDMGFVNAILKKIKR